MVCRLFGPGGAVWVDCVYRKLERIERTLCGNLVGRVYSHGFFELWRGVLPGWFDCGCFVSVDGMFWRLDKVVPLSVVKCGPHFSQINK